MRFALLSSVLLPILVHASPVSRQTYDNDGACQGLFNQCAADNRVTSDLKNVFSVLSCVMGATCFGGQRPVDSFLYTLYEAKNNGSSTGVVNGREVDRVTDALMDDLSEGGASVDQQSFIDEFNNQCATTNGPYASPEYLAGYYDRVATWTGFCDGPGRVPFKNFADYYEYSSAVMGGCSSSS